MNLNDVNLNNKTETFEKMIEGLLNAVKIEIQNLDTEIESLNKQKDALRSQKSRLQNLWFCMLVLTHICFCLSFIHMDSVSMVTTRWASG